MAKILKTSFMNFSDFLSYEGESFFDTPDFPKFPESDQDRFVIVTDQYLGRLDLVANDFYQDVDLWWVIALVNDIRVVPDGMSLGMKIRIPPIFQVRKYLAKANR